jgi:glycerate kinase
MIVVAPDKFKGSLAATTVASVLAGALRSADPNRQVIELPIADGGEGTVEVAANAGMNRVTTTVTGPMDTPVDAVYAVADELAVIELSAAAGLGVLDGSPDTNTAACATTFGVGQLILDAIEAGATTVVVGLGGSASTDGGAGMISALGAVLTTEDGTRASQGGASLGRIASVDLDPMLAKLDGVEVVFASDVNNPLTGQNGAAAIYGPQKGADRPLVHLLDYNLWHWGELIRRVTGSDVSEKPGVGAAGGTALPLVAAGCARIEPGAALLMELTGSADLIRNADVVVVGEGSLDRQSLRGKGPIGVAELAAANGAKVLAAVGTCSLSSAELDRTPIDRVYAMTDVEPNRQRCIDEPEPILEALANRLASDLTQPEEL